MFPFGTGQITMCHPTLQFGSSTPQEPWSKDATSTSPHSANLFDGPRVSHASIRALFSWSWFTSAMQTLLALDTFPSLPSRLLEDLAKITEHHKTMRVFEDVQIELLTISGNTRTLQGQSINKPVQNINTDNSASLWKIKKLIDKSPISIVYGPFSIATVDGRTPAPVGRWFILLFVGFQPSKLVQDFFHPQSWTRTQSSECR